MKTYDAGKFDIAVIGAGHAGHRGRVSPPRGWGCRPSCFTINLDAVGNMPCNPAIGGTGKGHLVRELDALGGEMGKRGGRLRASSTACSTAARAPPCYSLRAQADRRRYQEHMKRTARDASRTSTAASRRRSSRRSGRRTGTSAPL